MFFHLLKGVKQSACLLTSLFILNQGNGQIVASREYKVKAGFLYNFTQFVEWPDATFKGPDTPFTVGILGSDPFGAYLDSIIAGEKVMGHIMVVQRYQDSKDITNCQILFVNLPHSDISILADVQKEALLTVSDSRDFMKVGGMVRFFTQNNKIRLQINLSAVKAAKLNISAKLLQLADIYSDTK